MIVWTQQRLEFWEELNRNGIAYCNQQSWLYREYGFAYDWLTEQMRQRLGEPPMAEIKLPLWCWVQYASYKCKNQNLDPIARIINPMQRSILRLTSPMKCYFRATSIYGLGTA